jgi:signal transduction histidine kinase
MHLMRLTIRRKLFLAFLGVLAIPSLALFVTARAYLNLSREKLELAFLDNTRAVARQATVDIEAERKRLASAIQDLAASVEKRLPHIITRTELIMLSNKKIAKILRPGDDDDETPPDENCYKDVDAMVAELKRSYPEVINVQIQDDDGDPVGGTVEPYIDVRVPRGDGTSSVTLGDRMFLGARAPKQNLAVVVEIAEERMIRPRPIYGGQGWLFVADMRAGNLVGGPHPDGLPLQALVRGRPRPGELARIQAGSEVWREYAYGVQESNKTALLVAAKESAIFAKLATERAVLIGTAGGTLLVMLVLAYLLSGRFVDTITRIQRGVEALGRGELAELETSSTDELGGSLVESINRLAQKIAEQKRREEVDAWRRLVRVLSHEINNTLGPVRSAALTARDRVAPRIGDADVAGDLKTAFRLIVDRTDSLASFIGGYAELAKLPEPVRLPTDVAQVTSSAVQLLGDAARARSVSVEECYPENMPLAAADRAQLERVLINVVKNAVEAAASSVRVVVGTQAGDIQITVDDDGPGISVEAQRHLFVPYFTTKPGGSGIGLALARQILLAHGGTVDAEGRPEGGTRIRMTIPAA